MSDHEATARELYEIQEIEDKSTSLGIHYRITEIATDSRVATCYLSDNARLICDTLNGSAALLREAEARELPWNLEAELNELRAEIAKLTAERDAAVAIAKAAVVQGLEIAQNTAKIHIARAGYVIADAIAAEISKRKEPA